MDEVYKAIADGLLVVDQERESISDTDRVRVFRDTVSMTFHRRIEGRPNEALVTRKDVSISVGSKVDYDGIPYEVTFRGQGKLLLTGGDGHPEIPMDLVHQLQADGRLLIHNQETVTSENGQLVSIPGPQKLERILQRMELVELAKEQRVSGATDHRLPAAH